MSGEKIHIASRIEGWLLALLSAAVLIFSLVGNYEYIMNPKFRWLTVAGSILVILMGAVLVRRPRNRPGLSALVAFAILAAIVLAGKPYAYDVNSLTLPDLQGVSGVPLTIGETRYDFIGLKEMNESIVPGEEGYEGRRIVVTGLLKRSDDLDASGQVALMRPFSVCCAADALMVGMRAAGTADSVLTDNWVNIYGTVRRMETDYPPLKLRHGAIRYSAVSEAYILAADSIAPYIRPRPKEGIMDKLDSEKFSVFHGLAEKAGLEKMLEEHEMVTVLAPVNAAFDALPEGTVDELLERKNRKRLVEFVGRHVLPGILMASDLRGIGEAETITGSTVSITMVNGKLRAEGSRFLFKNIEVSDGVIHAIYPVISPPV
jgi:uncharacterized surface protein with fasciclin (FAS1) repeats